MARELSEILNLTRSFGHPLCSDCHVFAFSLVVIIMCGAPSIINSTLKGDWEVSEDTVIILLDLFK